MSECNRDRTFPDALPFIRRALDIWEKAGPGGHKEINRSNLSLDDIEAGLGRPVVQRQIDLLRFRAGFDAFGFDADCEVADTAPDRLCITWSRNGATATLDADLAAETFTIATTDASGVTGEV